MRRALRSFVVTARLFGHETFAEQHGFLTRVRFILLTLVGTACCSLRASKAAASVPVAIVDDDFELATMRFLTALRLYIVSLSAVQLLNMKGRREVGSRAIFSVIRQLERAVRCPAGLEARLRRSVREYVASFWVLLLLFWAKDFFIWNHAQLSEKEMILLYRALTCLVDQEATIMIWIQGEIIAAVNSHLQTIGRGAERPGPPQREVSRLERLRRAHGSACELSEALLGHYQAFLTFSLVVNFLDVVESAYYILVGLLNMAHTFEPQLFVAIILDCASWCLINLARLVHLTRACAAVERQCRRTVEIIIKMGFTTMNPLLREEVSLFRQQLMHTTVKYSIYNGTLPLNTTLVYVVCGTVASYMVVLVQFHTTKRASESCVTPT